ncbi:MAG: UbiA family prenyltransferase, partial [Flavitalea sp.]
MEYLAEPLHMKHYITLLRPKHWAKNLFLFVPSFFAGKFFDIASLQLLIGGFLAFSCLASSIYIINDYRDIEDDRKHPEKYKRPLASGAVKKSYAIVISILLTITGIALAYFSDTTGKFLFITLIYYALNISYSFG